MFQYARRRRKDRKQDKAGAAAALQGPFAQRRLHYDGIRGLHPANGESDAIRLMLDVHRQGVGLAGVFTYEVAQMKVDKVTSLAQANEFPLLCTMEEDASSQ